MRALIFIHVLYLILIKTFTVKGAAKCDSKVELRAVLLSCPVKDSGCDEDDALSQAMRAEESQILDTDPYNSERIKEEKSREFPSAVKDCKRKLIVTLKIKNAGKIPCDDEYIVVDHVFDPLTGGRGRLLSPVVIKLRQEQMVQLYGLQFQRVVNSDPFEEQKPSDGTCSINPQNPSCGITMYDGKPIPFSEGFCCSCDPHVNAKRQLSPLLRGESFPNRNSKFVYQGNAEFPGEDKANLIYNPELVKLKSGIQSDVSSKESDGIEVFDSLLADKIPNFLLEGDRKIVCDRGDFMKELCILRDDTKVTAKADLKKNTALEDSRNEIGNDIGELPFLARLEVTTIAIDARAPQPLNGDLERNAMQLRNFIKSLNLERSSSPDPLPTKGIRGKRENQRENKKLSLEEKLRRFAKSKERLMKRRKRLMEISHKRFRKTDERRPDVDESAYAMETWKPPPRYFFSHDREIIDPLESLDTGSNETCDCSKENFCEYPNKNRELGPIKSQNCGRFKDEKEGVIDRAFYQGAKNDKMTRKDKYFSGKAGFKKDRGKGEGGRLEKEDKKLKKEDETKLYGKKETEDMGAREQGKDQSSHFRPKNLKSFIHKSDREKSKLKHFFSARNREKEKPEFVRHKTGDLANQECLENDKCRNHAMDKANNDEENVVETKVKEEKGATGRDDDTIWETLQFSTENIKLFQQPQGGTYEGRSKLMKEPGRKYQAPPMSNYDSRLHRPDDGIGNVDFKINIIRNKNPEIHQRKHLGSWFGRFPEKIRADVSPKRYGSSAKAQKFRQNPSLSYFPSQKIYVYGKQNLFPDAYLMRSGSGLRSRYIKELQKEMLDSPKNIRRLQDEKAFMNKKPAQEYFLDNDDSLRENSYSAKWSDGDSSPISHTRGKRYPELHQQRSENQEETDRCENSRSKRSASYSFQPAKGFFESDLDSQAPDGRVIHELESCGRRRNCQSRPEMDNLTNDANMMTTPMAGAAKRSVKLPDKQRLIQSYLNAPDYVLEEIEGAPVKGKRESEHRKLKNLHEGPSFECADPQDTAHCMRFGDLWYSLYTIRKPTISQLVGIQMFDKHTVGEVTEWRDLTKGKMIRTGTFLAKAEDELPTISVTFSGERTGRSKNTIDPDNYFLLIPSHVSDASKASFYPQVDGGPSEYLLVPSKDISSGGECNMIGTSFEAFARQPDRCAQRKGSCLKRQPVDLWREDMEARIRGKRGKYFVENFGTVPNSPIKSYTNLTGEFLALEYYGEYTSTIEIEVKADSNAIIRRGSIAQIPLVYIDSTYPKKTRIMLSTLNSGLTSSNFRPRLGDCPPDLDVAWCPLEGPLVTIPPQQRHDFKLDLSGALPSKEILLTVQVLNQFNKEVATRKIIIKREHRCVCAFHCKCNCFGNSKDSRTCRRLSLEDYRKAGYIGVYPFRGGASAYAASSGSVLKYLHTILATASCLLLIFGVVKGILGLFVRRIGIAGVRIITGPRPISSYYESELKGCTVLWDECGFPVHPTTCRPVQIVPLCFELILNFFFFFLYPLRGIWFLIISLACCSSLYSDCRRDESEIDQKLSRPLLSKEPEPTFVHYNLTTINPKRSKHEYLPYPAYKGDDDPLEEDDTEFVLQEMKRYRKK